MPRKTCKEDIEIRVAEFPENRTRHGQMRDQITNSTARFHLCQKQPQCEATEKRLSLGRSPCSHYTSTDKTTSPGKWKHHRSQDHFSARLLTKSMPFGNVVKCCLCNWWSPSIYPHFSRLTFKEGHSTTKYVAGGWLRGSGFLSRCKGFPTMEKLLFMNPRSCPIPLCYPFRDGIYHSTSEHLVHANLSHEPYPLHWQRIKIASRSKNSKKRKDTGWNN